MSMRKPLSLASGCSLYQSAQSLCGSIDPTGQQMQTVCHPEHRVTFRDLPGWYEEEVRKAALSVLRISNFFGCILFIFNLVESLGESLRAIPTMSYNG